MADKTLYNRNGDGYLVSDATSEVQARFNGFSFDKAPTEKQAASHPAAAPQADK